MELSSINPVYILPGGECTALCALLRMQLFFRPSQMAVASPESSAAIACLMQTLTRRLWKGRSIFSRATAKWTNFFVQCFVCTGIAAISIEEECEAVALFM